VGLLLHAPNVHTGGGLVLLRQLLAAAGDGLTLVQLDERTRGRIEVSPAVARRFVKRSLSSRAYAEWRLWRASTADSVLLCFAGMPPWLPVRGRVVVFQQNCNLLGINPLRQFPFRVALRIALERAICRVFRHRVHEYVVQSPHMKRELTRWRGGSARIRVLPFADLTRSPRDAELAGERFDFVYVASGDGHKNHERLLDAWVLLAEQGIFPSLALTVEPDNRYILDRVHALSRESGLREPLINPSYRRMPESIALHSLDPGIRRDDEKRINQKLLKLTNLGVLEHEEVLDLYLRAGALIFPSLGESLGLPLLEAARAGLPIVAAERDYVRDIVTPAETFDPESPVSIARAVRRFLHRPEKPVSVMSASEFLEQLLRL
jgi:glycosyltransferase involved in cell wall biosynthesis